MRYCGNCKYLFPKESAQSSHKEHHVCRKYNQRVIHAYHHPELVRLNGCEEPLNEPIKEKNMNIKEVEPYSQYIGDGVYLIDKRWDGYHYWLITTDGIDIQNKIALDHGCVLTLVRALKRGVNDEYAREGNILG